MSSAIFDENFYLSNYPDIKAAVDAGGFTSGLEHFEQNGLSAGRVLVSPLYNEESYLQANPDVAAAVATGDYSSGLQHFILSGEAKGRSGLTFNEEFYLQKYPDVAEAVEAGDFSSGLDHFLAFGQAEGRSGDLFFDEKFYLEKYPDVAEAVEAGDFSSGLQHFLLFGKGEDRSGTPFNEEVYLDLDSNSDVAEAVEAGNFSSGLQHYVQYGQNEEERLALFSGTSGNDIITGFGEGSTIIGIEVTTPDVGTVQFENSGEDQVDTLIGGAGTDLFILGIAPSSSNIQGGDPSFYVGGGSADYAVIQNFELGQDDIQLAGYQSFFYNVEVVDGSLNISTRDFSTGDESTGNGDLIAIVEGVTSIPQFSDGTSTGTVQLG